jgi:hypothetical protein
MVTLNEAEFDMAQKCSLFSRTSGDDSIGQARSYKHQIFLEAPAPWVFNFVESETVPAGVADVMTEVAEAKVDVNLLGALPDDAYSQDGMRHLFYFKLPEEGLFSGTEKKHYVIPVAEVAGAVRAILLERDTMDQFAKYLQNDEDTREMFVCTHGARDACCATFGYPVYKKIRDEYSDRPELNMRVWRTSHTGGHRFAPTVLDYPEGRYWARLDEGWVESALYHKGPLEAMRPHIRGLSGLGRLEQVVDREILLREGWGWIDYRKRGQTTIDGVTNTDPLWVMNVDGGDVRIDFEAADGTDKGHYNAHLVYDGVVPFGGCGKKLGWEQQYRVTSMERVSD